jgi:hypothetical protein
MASKPNAFGHFSRVGKINCSLTLSNWFYFPFRWILSVMNEVMSYASWREGTKTRMLRADSLKAVDRELQAYHRLKTRSALVDLSRIWEEYKSEKIRGDDQERWKSSRRNRLGMLGKFDRQISRALAQPLSEDEKAFAVVAQANEQVVDRVFREGWSGGCRLVLRPSMLQALINNFRKDVTEHRANSKRAMASGQLKVLAENESTFRSGLNGCVTIGKTVVPFGFGSEEGQDIQDPNVLEVVASVVADAFGEALELGLKLIPEVISEFVAKLAAEIIPWVGVGTSGISAIKSAGQLGWSFTKDMKLIWNLPSNVMLPGAPQMAIVAVLEMMRREKSGYAVDLSRHTAICGAKMASIVVDGGAAIGPLAGAANAVAGMILKIYELGRNLIEVFRANRRLAGSEPITKNIFLVNPLMAAYFILDAPTSALIPFFGDIAESNKARKRIEPLMEISSEFLMGSRYELVNADGTQTMAHKSQVTWASVSRSGLDKPVSLGFLNRLARKKDRATSNVRHLHDQSPIEAYAEIWKTDVSGALEAQRRARTHIDSVSSSSQLDAFTQHEVLNPLVVHENEMRKREEERLAVKPIKHEDDIPQTINPISLAGKSNHI